VKAKVRGVIKFLIGAILLLAIIAIVLKVANPLPSRHDIPKDAPLPTIQSRIAKASAEFNQNHDGQTALLLLTRGIDAFAMRLAMVRNAQRSIDAQYYIWHDDLSGRMLLSEIVRAADRGVRVRLLIDDNPTAGLDGMWFGVNSHPNISVRIFNPLTIRSFRPLNYLFDFPRLNRRMHNKSFTVDGVASVVGGRNVGDEYFGAVDKGLFIDVDAFAVGAAVPEVAATFEQYWRAKSAFPAERILASSKALSLAELRDPLFVDSARADGYRAASIEAVKTLGLDDPSAAFIWAPVRLVADDPEKAMGRASRSSMLASQIVPLFNNAQSRIDLVSGYFVPGDFGKKLLVDAAGRGAVVQVATNSIQVTDVPLVHAGYAPYRKPLLRAGVKMYEARPFEKSLERPTKVIQTRFSGGGESVHAKVFAIDRQTVFIGSFNFDPRSALLNCEMGFIVDSPNLANALGDELDERLPESTYALGLDEKDKLFWTSTANGKMQKWHTEPGTNFVSRSLVSMLSLLPIQWLL
jgi:cardiolipin synthase C